MAIIDVTGRKSWKIRFLIFGMYLLLALLGVTMVFPFLITITSSVANDMDYHQFYVLPRWLYSREERFVRGLPGYFPTNLRGSMDQFTLEFHEVPPSWGNWQNIGQDTVQIHRFAKYYLDQTKDQTQWTSLQRQAADYSDFVQQYPLDDLTCAYDLQTLPGYFRQKYYALARKDGATRDLEGHALALLSKNWEVPYTSFYEVNPWRELSYPMDQPTFFPPSDKRAMELREVAVAYRNGELIPGFFERTWRQFLQTHDPAMKSSAPFPVPVTASSRVRKLWQRYLAENSPLLLSRPNPLKPAWLSFLGSPQGRLSLGLPDGGSITIDEYNSVFGTQYSSLAETPFPVPGNAPEKLRRAWNDFVSTRYPLRLVEVQVTPQLTQAYRAFLQERLKGSLAQYRTMSDQAVTSWSQVPYPATMPTAPEELANLWMEFTQKQVSASALVPHSAESRYQRFLIAKYHDLREMNRVYGTHYRSLEQIQLPLDAAYLVTFVKNERGLTSYALTRNFAYVWDNLAKRGRAILNTILLIALTLFATLTVNPLAAYALSRFRMKQTPAVILYLLATMAFPGAVSMIPGFLLMRDFHLLNTYWALILPGLANGMAIFMLKGFFDSLPPELYEAAMLDGCPEWQMFLRITLPLTKPILAVQALGAFMGAYGSWDWALIVCQDSKMWTLSVWLYQFAQMNTNSPWVSMAAFILASVPVFVVFLLCQNIILRGIILPQMK